MENYSHFDTSHFDIYCSSYDDYDILFGGNNKSFLIMVLEDHCASGKSYLDGAYEMRIE